MTTIKYLLILAHLQNKTPILLVDILQGLDPIYVASFHQQ